VIVEDYLEGEEVSILAFSDGETVIPMVSSQDHKRYLIMTWVPIPEEWVRTLLFRL